MMGNVKNRCYWRGTSPLGLLNTILGCLCNRVLVKCVDDDSGETTALLRERADEHPPERAKHSCEPGSHEDYTHIFPHGNFGAAVDRCVEDEQGRLWVDNREYKNRVNYCPFCGYRAKSQVEWSG